MKSKLLHAAVAAAVVAGAGFGLGKAVEALPSGRARRAAERFALDPGRALAERLGDSRAARKARKAAKKDVEAAARKAEDALEARGVDPDRLAALYTAGAWAGLGFIVCVLGALALGVSSVFDALALGLKVSLAFAFLQGAAACGLYLFLKGR